MDSAHSDIALGLLEHYSRALPAGAEPQILGCDRISDGWETDVYAFTLEHGGASAARTREDLILRIFPGRGAAQKAVHEFDVMGKLLAAGFPVPRVFVLELDDAFVGGPFVIMEKIDGRPMGSVADQGSAKQRQVLLTQFTQMMVDLHRLDWHPFVVDPAGVAATGDAAQIIQDELSNWRVMAHSLQNHVFDPALDWLQEKIQDVRFGAPSVIHLDYHPYNVLLREDGGAFVIDWTNAQVSDYRLDLAWTLLLNSSYGHPETRQLLLGEYERLCGDPVEEIAFFEVAASLRRLASILISLSAGAQTLGMRAGAEAMMVDIPHITSVYAIFCDRSGLRIPEIEELLSKLS
jgi:aminoglycoside phosphotransferase (APT) family kinase protein